MPAKKTTKKTATKRATKKTARKSTAGASSSRPPSTAGNSAAKRAKKRAKKKTATKRRQKVAGFWPNVKAFFAGAWYYTKKIFLAPFRFVSAKSDSWPPFFKWSARIILPPAFWALVMFVLMASFYTYRASRYDIAELEKMPARTVVYDRNGEVIGHLHGINRLMVKHDYVAEYFRMALVAREDARFYDHNGIDLRGVGRSVYLAMTSDQLHGASTITMQLAENSFDYDGKSIDGKLLEMALARRIEGKYSKEEILEMYMNRIFWGHSIRGIESAAQTYFEKSSSDLTLSESAMLAGIISGPNSFSPFKNLDKAKEKRDITLRSMVQYEFITQDQADEAMKEELKIRPKHRRRMKKSYALAAIQRDLDKILEEKNIKMGGLKVKTTLDMNLQREAESSINSHLRGIERKRNYPYQTYSAYDALPKKNRPAPNYVQGALVCLENKTGAVVAVVGGRNPEHSEFNRAFYANRSIGSVFKPFVYLAAFERGLHHRRSVDDSRLRRHELVDSPNWSPKNSDGQYKPSVRVEDALIQSRNTSSVRVGNYAGIDNVVALAKKIGFQGNIPRGSASFLGAFAATPWEVAKAYTVFPNAGTVYRPYLITEITDADGNVVYEGSGVIPWEGPSRRKAWLTSNLLGKVTQYGTARAVSQTYGLKHTAGKTGTTDKTVDGWFAGYTSELTCVVWVGMDDNKPLYISRSGQIKYSASSLAVPIWSKFMKAANTSYPMKNFTHSKEVELCRHTNQYATAKCKSLGLSYKTRLPIDKLPMHSCDKHPSRAELVEPDGSLIPRAIPAE